MREVDESSIKRIPSELAKKLVKFVMKQTALEGGTELIVLYGENREIFKKTTEEAGIKFEDLGFGYGIVTLNSENVFKVDEVQGLVYAEFPKALYIADIESNRASCIPRLWNSEYELSGEGVLIGFIDTGIEYTHDAFKDEKGETRIEYIYNMNEKKIYNKAQINEALKSPNPLAIVPETDKIGHGTHVVGIACAGGKINRSLYGPAYKSKIAMVKITRGGKSDSIFSTQVMRGIKFLLDKAKELDKSKELNIPVVINISLSTNEGSHNGTSLLETYIQTVSNNARVSIVVAAGNEGEAGHHIGGEIKPITNINFIIGEAEKEMVLYMHKVLLVDLSVKITNPSGQVSEEFMLKEGYKVFNLGKERIGLYISGPKPFNVEGEISIDISTEGERIQPGEWKLEFRKLNNYRGEYDIWLPVSDVLNPKTKFLQSTAYNTVGIPATTNAVIAVGSYNYQTNTISSFSGRGRVMNKCFVKPDILAPGENILSTGVGNNFDTRTGTSMAAAAVAGACALLIEWGVIKKNRTSLYGQRLKYYLVKGANRMMGNVQYPDASYGYGSLCAESAIKLILGSNLYRGEKNYWDYLHENREDFKDNILIEEELKTPIENNEDLLEEYEADTLFYLNIENDDMKGYGMSLGDIVLCHRTKDIKNNDIYLLEYNGKRIVRQVIKIDRKKLLLISNEDRIMNEIVKTKKIKPIAVVIGLK